MVLGGGLQIRLRRFKSGPWLHSKKFREGKLKMFDSKDIEKIRKTLKEAGNIGLYAYQVKREANLEESAKKIGMYIPSLDFVRVKKRSGRDKYLWDGKSK